MRRFTFGQLFRFGPSPFGLFVGVVSFALGLVLASLSATPRVPTVNAVDARVKKGGMEYAGRETCAEAHSRYEDRYYNHSYGYSVALPAGADIQTPTPPDPQQGFSFNFTNATPAEQAAKYWPYSHLYVRGRTALNEWETLYSVVETHLSFLRESSRNVRVVSRTETSLGGLPAARVVALYDEGGKTMVNDQVIAVSEADGLVYFIELDGELSTYDKDGPAVDAMRKSFCLQPRP